MKRLSKDQEKRKAECVTALNEAKLAVQNAIAEANGVIAQKVHAAVGAYNDAVADADAFREEMVGEMDSYADERSDNWREGDAGQAYEAWKNDWESLDGDELSDIEEIEEPDMDHADNLEQLQHEPDR